MGLIKLSRLRSATAQISQRWRCFSSSTRLREIRDIAELPNAVQPVYHETKPLDLLSLKWPSPPRNVLLTKKEKTPHVTESLVEFVKHICNTYPSMSLILEPETASEIHESLSFPVFTVKEGNTSLYADKVDLVSTLGGDGTILHASALFASSPHVPPILSFSMGTLGFLGEWRFSEYKRAFREVYMSGAGAGSGDS